MTTTPADDFEATTPDWADHDIPDDELPDPDGLGDDGGEIEPDDADEPEPAIDGVPIDDEEE